MAKPKIILNNDMHRGQEVITLRFDYDQKLIAAVKKLNGMKWSRSKKCWYVLSEGFILGQVFDHLRDFAYIDYSGIK